MSNAFAFAHDPPVPLADCLQCGRMGFRDIGRHRCRGRLPDLGAERAPLREPFREKDITSRANSLPSTIRDDTVLSCAELRYEYDLEPRQMARVKEFGTQAALGALSDLDIPSNIKELVQQR